jgi:hypothetical protein
MMSTSRTAGALAIVLAGFGLAGCGDASPPATPTAGSRVAPPAADARDRAAAADAGARERNVVRKKLPREMRSIALEYTVLLVDESGTERAVDPAAHTFQVGDSFLVRIKPQDDLYVYVFNEGPGGQRTCLLPTADEPPRLVKAGTDIALPDDGGFFTFEPPAGEEKLVVVALPEPTDDVRMLAAAVFKGQAVGLRSEEAAASRKQADAALDALREKSGAAVRTRGPVRKIVERLDAGVPAGTTVSHVEPPHDGEPSSYGIAVSATGDTGPELILDIPLRSRSEGAAAGGQ